MPSLWKKPFVALSCPKPMKSHMTAVICTVRTPKLCFPRIFPDMEFCSRERLGKTATTAIQSFHFELPLLNTLEASCSDQRHPGCLLTFSSTAGRGEIGNFLLLINDHLVHRSRLAHSQIPEWRKLHKRS